MIVSFPLQTSDNSWSVNETDFVYVFRKNDWDLGTDRVNISLVEKVDRIKERKAASRRVRQVDLAYWADDDEMEKEKKEEVDEDRFQELTFEVNPSVQPPALPS